MCEIICSSSLRSGLRELEQLLSEQPVLYSAFRGGDRMLQLVLGSGAVATANISRTGDLQRIVVDKVCIS